MSLPLTPLNFINGLFSFLVISTGIIIGILILIKYKNYHSKEFLFWGIAFIGLYIAWWPSSFSFLMYLFTGNQLSLELYIAIGTISIPFFLTFWLLGFFELTNLEKRMVIIIIYSIIFIIAEIYIIYFLIVNPSELGTFTDNRYFDIKFGLLNIIYVMFIALTVATTGIIVAREALESKDRLIRLKGKFLLYAFITYPICGFIDGGLDLNEISLIVIRTVLISGAICFYIGLFIPKFFKKLFKLEK